ncbi:MAG: hypothetical protein MMC33_009407 [Icmadophila ericetorum]|nr:hypothetical protein [Icmadophila ericetorum]
MDNQARLRKLSDEYQILQNELQSAIHARQTLESQQQENKGVQKEFSTLSPESNIYKLVGPTLLKQDYSEATLAVEGRLNFINKEMYAPITQAAYKLTDHSEKVEKQISNVQEVSEKKKIEIYQLQVKMQAEP